MSEPKERVKEVGAGDDRVLCEDSDDSEAFADALDKLPANSDHPVFDKTERDTFIPQDDSQDDEDDEETGKVETDEVQLRQEAEDRLSQEELESRREDALKLKADANQQYVSTQFDEAITTYTEALQICPLKFKHDRAIFYSNRAAAKLKKDDKESALEDCNEALGQSPTYLKALVRRAQLFEELDKPHESMRDYEEVLKVDPKHIEAKVAVASRLPEKIKEKDEKLKAEMMDNLKKLGNMMLNPFGMSTDNFNFVQDPNTGGYSVNFSKW